MANNLPANIRKHTLFQENEYSHTIVFPEGFTMPNSVTAEVRRDGVVQEGILPTVTVNNLRVTFTYTVEMLAKMYSRYEQYFIFGDDYLLGGYVLISNEFGDPSDGETQVVIAGEQVTTIEIPGLTLVDGKLQEVLTAANQVSLDKQTVSDDKIAVEAGRSATEGYRDEVIDLKEDVTTLKEETNQIKSDIGIIRDEAVSAKDQVVALAAANVTVQNYSDAVPLFTGSIFRRIDVKTDAVYNLDDDPASPTYNQGLPSFYTYNPALPSGKRVAFLGLDPDYLTNS